MTDRYQLARGDGPPIGWSIGREDFAGVWENAYDRLRFHRGGGFTIRERPDDPGVARRLREVGPHLEPRLANAPRDTIFEVGALSDGFKMLFRRHEVFDDKGDLIVQHGLERLGTHYILGATDCSWLTMFEYGEEGIVLPHKAGSPYMPSQLHDPQVTLFSKDHHDWVKRGDLLFHWGDRDAVDHVSTYMDNQGPGGTGRVLDTEPHDTRAPAGWPTTYLGTGVRIRPMISGYYCDWEHVVAVGRVEAINGKVGT